MSDGAEQLTQGERRRLLCILKGEHAPVENIDGILICYACFEMENRAGEWIAFGKDGRVYGKDGRVYGKSANPPE